MNKKSLLTASILTLVMVQTQAMLLTDSPQDLAIRITLQKALTTPCNERLVIAASFGDLAQTHDLLSKGDIDVNFQLGVANGQTALIAAVLLHLYDDSVKAPIVEKLLTAGADPNIQDNSGKTALMWAAAHKNQLSVGLLLKHGANRHLKDANGMTALDYAKKYGTPVIVSLIEKA